jgi:putative acetyltransferase
VPSFSARFFLQEENEMKIRLETPGDYSAVESLTREAFWNVYKPGCSEHYILHAFRERPEFIKELDFVLEDNDVMGNGAKSASLLIVAHVMFARAQLTRSDGIQIPVCTFGPISVRPDMQRKGYGRTLLAYALEKASQLGYGAACITGNIVFYGTCGFVTASSRSVAYAADAESDAPYFLLKELSSGFLNKRLAGKSASFREPDGYFVCDDDVEAFDRQFPPKEKLKLPGQLF